MGCRRAHDRTRACSTADRHACGRHTSSATVAQVLNVRCGGTCGQVLQVQVPALGLVEFDCPICQTKNQISCRVPPGVARPPVETPPWWKVQPTMGEYKLASVSNEQMALVQKMLGDTWKSIVTRDRAKCSIAGTGGAPVSKRLQVLHVQHNCNPKLWSNYHYARSDIAAKMNNSPTYTFATSKVIQDLENSSALGPLDASVNECFLFHGTNPSACESICKSDFMVNLAGSHAGSLYGQGIYFGENSSKSDEYASDDSSGIYSGLYAMLLCRVTCGRILYTDDVHPNVDELMHRCTKTMEYDSVLGDREKARGTYREFIVYQNDQAYPEYVVIYRREY